MGNKIDLELKKEEVKPEDSSVSAATIKTIVGIQVNETVLKKKEENGKDTAI